MKKKIPYYIKSAFVLFGIRGDENYSVCTEIQSFSFQDHNAATLLQKQNSGLLMYKLSLNQRCNGEIKTRTYLKKKKKKIAWGKLQQYPYNTLAHSSTC